MLNYKLASSFGYFHEFIFLCAFVVSFDRGVKLTVFTNRCWNCSCREHACISHKNGIKINHSDCWKNTMDTYRGVPCSMCLEKVYAKILIENIANNATDFVLLAISWSLDVTKKVSNKSTLANWHWISICHSLWSESFYFWYCKFFVSYFRSVQQPQKVFFKKVSKIPWP